RAQCVSGCCTPAQQPRSRPVPLVGRSPATSRRWISEHGCPVSQGAVPSRYALSIRCLNSIELSGTPLGRTVLAPPERIGDNLQTPKGGCQVDPLVSQTPAIRLPHVRY